jgi:uncharacterized membrane protein
MNDVIVARVLHVLAVVIWIGGVSMVTTVVLPALRRRALGETPIQAFHAIERRFVWQARTALIVVGITGLYMVARLQLWARFRSAEFWWMHAMVCLWLLFATILFIVEPLMSRRSPAAIGAQSANRLAWLQRGHWILLALSLITVAGAVAGSQGWSF